MGVIANYCFQDIYFVWGINAVIEHAIHGYRTLFYIVYNVSAVPAENALFMCSWVVNAA